MEKQEDVSKTFQKMSVGDQDINILLLGETGVGKSTFINSFANYLEYAKFDIAEANTVRCLIPAKFTVTNENFEEKLVEIGKDSNENNTIYESATLETRSYVFPISKLGIERIRLIDTPGIGDVSGIDRDNENMENVLSYISHLEDLHAICFLLKPNNTRLTVMFHYCIKQLLSRLEKSASKNIIFLFTNTRSTFYKPGDTTTALRKILNDIKDKSPHIEIKFTKDNVFCLDNESFRYLVAVKNNIELGNKESFVDSWTHSVQECWRMIDFITGKGNSTIKIKPHKVKDTMSVNEARRVILQLSQPLADIADLINENIISLEKHNKSLQTENLSIAQLKENLYVPVINLRCKELSQPCTVCTAFKCCELYMVRDIKKYHYKQRCHDPCNLKNVPREQIGSPELVHCSAMENRKCKKCQCDFSTHMHIYYISETFEDKIDNEGIKAQIKDRETALKATQGIIEKILATKLDYEKEKDTIIKTMAKFAHFLQRNAIAPYNDSYKSYIEYLIDREKSLNTKCDNNVLKHYNELLKMYEEEKHILEEAVSSNSGANTNITVGFIFDSVRTLYMLPHTGKKIQELYTKQSQNQKREHNNTEIVLENCMDNSRNNKINNTDGKSKKNKKKPKNKRSKPTDNDQQRFNMQDFRQNERTRDKFAYQPVPFQAHQPRPNRWSYGDFQSYQYGNPQNEFNNFAPNHQRNFPGHSEQYGNFPGRSQYFQNFNSFPQPNKPNNDFHNNMNIPFNNDSTTNQSNRDSGFDEWFKNMVAGNSSFSEQASGSNNRTQKQNYFLNSRSVSVNASKNLSSDSSESIATESDDNDIDDDDEAFKDFMKKNNLEYLVKSSRKNSYGNKQKSLDNLNRSFNEDDDREKFRNSRSSTRGNNKSFMSNLLGTF